MTLPAAMRKLSPDDLGQSARSLLANEDVAILTGPDSRIRQIGFGPGFASREDARALRGRLCAELVQPADRAALNAMLTEALAGASPPPLVVRTALDVTPTCAIRLTAKATGNGDGALMIGRGLDAEASVKPEDIWPRKRARRLLEDMEERYRLVFDAAPEAILFVDPDRATIVEANPNARRLLAPRLAHLGGYPLVALFEPDTADAVRDMLRGAGHAGQRVAHAVIAGTSTELKLEAEAVRSFHRNLLMIRMTPPDRDVHAQSGFETRARALLWHAETPVSLIDPRGTILWANAAFAELGEGGGDDETIAGRRLDSVLGLSERIFNLALEKAAAHGRVRLADLGPGTDAVKAEAVILALDGAPPEGFGLLLHEMPGPDPEKPNDIAKRRGNEETIAELVGKAPMRRLVRETTDMIERNCIEAALRLTNNNRAAAAEVLGLSRQSLYAKLHQYALL